MKRISVWFAWTLIALALLLSGAKSEKPSPRPTTNRSTPLAQERNSYPSEAKGDFVRPSSTPKSAEAQRAEPAKNEHGPPSEEAAHTSNQAPENPQPRDWLQIIFNFWLTVATVALAVFTWRLVGVTRDVHMATVKGTEVANENVKAAKVSAEAAKAQLEFTKTANKQNIEIATDATEAAKQSAKAADLALHINRPFLVPDKFEFKDDALKTVAKMLTGGAAERVIRTAIRTSTVPVAFLLKNYGKGPAVINRISGRIAVVGSIDEVPIRDFSECEEWPATRKVLAADQEIEVTSPVTALLGITNPNGGSLTPEQQSAVVNSQATLIVYGQISYADLFDAMFFVDFFWMYSAFLLHANPALGGFAMTGPKERNRHHQ